MSTRQDKSAATVPMVVVFGEMMMQMCRDSDVPHLVDASLPFAILNHEDQLRHEIAFFDRFVILTPEGGEAVRDRAAILLGDEHCSWAYLPDDPKAIPAAVAGARPMWTDEIAGLEDIPEPGPEKVYRIVRGDEKGVSGFVLLDKHGFRITLPAFMPIIGPYGSGKSVLLQQLLVALWRLHGWKFLLTAFEERVKPRYRHNFRRHLIGRPLETWTETDVAHADNELNRAGKFFLRKRNTVLDLDRLINRIEFAVRVYGLKVIAIDPINEVDHVVPRGENRTDYFGKLIMRLKQLADDYELLMIVCAHPPKDGVEKRMARGRLLTLNDGADTAHWGNKADIGWCVWRPMMDGATLLHVDKLKYHEAMGEPTLAELALDKALGCFDVMRTGYDILNDDEERHQ